MDRASEYNQAAARLLGHVENRTTDLDPDVLYLPAGIYTDAERYQREIDLIFKRVPLMVAMTLEMPNPGDFKTIEMIGLPLLVTRGADGVARTFLNVCTHRGAPVAEQERGNAGRFTCRYHAWTFRNDGRLMGVADAEKFGAIDKDCHNLTELPCAERAGLIFAVLTPGGAMDIDAWLGGMKAELEHFGFHNWYYHGKREIFGANWKVAYDGYLENYHFAALHATTIAPRSIVHTMDFRSFGPHIRLGFPSPGIREIKNIPREKWWERELVDYRFIRTLFPNISISLAHGIGQIAQLIPGPTVDENRTVLNYFAPHAPKNDAEREAYDTAMTFYRDVTNDEDYVMGLKIQKGLKSPALKQVVFGRNERGNQFFHKWVNWMIEGQKGEPPKAL
jgi:phenylpropionate dioxygenase-like ring-hydroxylating dioxygenase large terminal subunit